MAHSVGFASSPDGQELILVASVSGRGVYDCSTGALIARDRDDGDWMTDNNEFCRGIGPLEGITVRVSSIWEAALFELRQTDGVSKSCRSTGRSSG